MRLRAALAMMVLALPACPTPRLTEGDGAPLDAAVDLFDAATDDPASLPVDVVRADARRRDAPPFFPIDAASEDPDGAAPDATTSPDRPHPPPPPPGVGRFGDPCDPASITDLDAVAVNRGAYRVYEGRNDGVPERSLVPALDCEHYGYMRVFRHRVPVGHALELEVRPLPSPWRAEFVVARIGACSRAATGLCEESLFIPFPRRAGWPPVFIPTTPGQDFVFALGSARTSTPGIVSAGRFEIAFRDVPLPVVPLGGRCNPSDFAPPCGEGQRCDWETSRCVIPGPEGAPCAPPGPCDDDLVCDPATRRCARATPVVPLGANCAGRVCAAGSVCAYIDASPVCALPGTRGAPCDAERVCGDGLGCSAAGRCAPLSRWGSCTTHEGCPAGSECLSGVADGTIPSAGYFCYAPGTRLGSCRASAPRCDAGLACVRQRRLDERCTEIIPEGGRCPPFAEAAECAAGTWCTYDGICRRVAFGARGEPCRTETTMTRACDDGLACDGRFCRPLGAAGDVCEGPGAVTCPFGTRCAALSYLVSEPARCVEDGRVGGGCRGADDGCDLGAACSALNTVRPRCLRLVGPGERCGDDPVSICPAGYCSGGCPAPGSVNAFCDPTAQNCQSGHFCRSDGICVRSNNPDGSCSGDECAPGQSCVPLVWQGRCAPDGAPYTACRATDPRCDAGAVCLPHTSRCAPILAVGAECHTDRERFDLCPEGSSCRTVSDDAYVKRCLLDGAAGGRCRGASPSCETGLACAGRPGALDSICL